MEAVSGTVIKTRYEVAIDGYACIRPDRIVDAREPGCEVIEMR